MTMAKLAETGAAVDDMLGRFDRTSTAYKAGFSVGAERKYRQLRGVIERAMWAREGRSAMEGEFQLLKSLLDEFDSAKSLAPE